MLSLAGGLGALHRVAPDDGGETEGVPGAEERNVKVLIQRTVSLFSMFREYTETDSEGYESTRRKLLFNEMTAPRDTLWGLKQRLEVMHTAGLPRMRLLPGKVLEELGRIPRSTDKRADGELYTVDALEMVEREIATGAQIRRDEHNWIIVFFSHRWLRANMLHQRDVERGSAGWLEAAIPEESYVGMPDSESNDKARDLIEWMRWLKWRTSRGIKLMNLTQNCKDVYFFIDWSCVDQTDPVPYICALPAFLACCTLFASHYTEEYKERAWCQAEMLLNRAFRGSLVMRVPSGFKHEEQVSFTAGQLTPRDPRAHTAMITNEDDRPAIAEFAKHAFQFLARGAWEHFGSRGNIQQFQLVEPCGARAPFSWNQIRLWFYLEWNAACSSIWSLLIFLGLFCFWVAAAVGLVIGDQKSVYHVSISFISTDGNTSIYQVLLGLSSLLFCLWGIAASVFSYPSIAQTMAPETQKWLARGIKVGFVNLTIVMLAPFAVESALPFGVGNFVGAVLCLVYFCGSICGGFLFCAYVSPRGTELCLHYA